MITNLFRLPGFTRKPGEKKNNGSNFFAGDEKYERTDNRNKDKNERGERVL